MKKDMLDTFLDATHVNDPSISAKKAKEFFKMLRDEVTESSAIYGPEDAEELKTYYQHTQQSANWFNFVEYHYAERLKHIIAHITKGITVLDAGCGLGSESILFAALGAKVNGVDIDKRLDTAKLRIKHYQTVLNTKLEIDFIKQSIFDYQGKADIIWVNEAISHIDPIEKFLNHAYSILNPNGYLIIADANKLNPIIFLQTKIEQRQRGGKVIKVHDPNTGKEITYANERIFTIYEIKKVLSGMFQIKVLHPFYYFPLSLFTQCNKLALFTEKKILAKIPFIKYLIPASYYIEGQKKELIDNKK